MHKVASKQAQGTEEEVAAVTAVVQKHIHIESKPPFKRYLFIHIALSC